MMLFGLLDETGHRTVLNYFLCELGEWEGCQIQL